MSEKHLTEKAVQDALAPMIGQKVGYDVYETQNAVRRLLDEFYGTEDGDVGRFITISKDGPWRILLSYKGQMFGTVEVKRSKGAGHYNIFGGHYNDWTYRQFCVWLWSNEAGVVDVEARMREIDEMADRSKKAEAERLEKARKAFALLKSEMGFSSDYETQEFIAYMNGKRYSLCS